MFILKNVVAKLWMTIIGLVAVVLLILGLFLFSFIDTSFPKSADQKALLTRIGEKAALETAEHPDDPTFLKTMNDVLSAQDTGMILYDRTVGDRSAPLLPPDKGRLTIGDVFQQSELDQLFAGQELEPRKVDRRPGTTEDYLVMAAPIKGNKGAGGQKAVILYQSLKTVESMTTYVKKLFAFVSFIGFLLTTFFAFFLITRITRPLLQLNKAADLITQGEYGTRVPALSSDEIGQLAKTFNLMGARLEETITDLNHEKDNLSSVLASMADAVMAFDVDGYVIFANPYARTLIDDWNELGWDGPEEEETDRPGPIPQPLRPLFARVINETGGLTNKLHVKNGVWSVVMAPLYSSGEAVRGAVAVLRDVTEEFRLDKLRKDFVANISHELRTPLSMLQGYSEALLDDIAASPEERRELAQVIHDESLRMGRLVRDLLDLARMEAGHMEFNFRECDVGPLLRRVGRKFQALCKEQGIRLDVELAPSSLMLEQGDEDRLEQVFTNLLDNAIRHTPSGARIRIAAFTAVEEGRQVLRVDLEDEGKGIPAADLPYIFERFYKADKARTRGATGGTGLGLAIVRNIIEAHRGRIRVQSVVGQGTTFTLVLPLSTI